MTTDAAIVDAACLTFSSEFHRTKNSYALARKLDKNLNFLTGEYISLLTVVVTPFSVLLRRSVAC